MIREEVTDDGKYCLVLVFEAKALQLSDFERRQAKFRSFFGPGITSEIGKGENDLYEVRLISETTSQPSSQM
ncbi:putative thylakoid membrane protein [Cocos nucifera]|nr:putative thylakoid membrane protein [Cocos nucifera]